MDDLLTPLLPSGLNVTSPLIDELLVDDVDTDSCRLLGPVALAVQGALGFIVIGGLVIKRMREKPRRKWKIWLADVGKQVVGQMAVHMSNVAISDLIASNRSDNPCSLYALNILIDTTLGVLLLYFLLQYSTILMQRFQPLYKTGFYGTPFSFSLWAEQAAVYVACLAVMKIVVLVIFWIAPELEDGMSWGLSWIEHAEAQVVIVMLILPLVMNLFQFLIIDSIIRMKDPSSPSTLAQNSDEEALRRGFLEDGSDNDDEDEEDGHGGERRHARGASRRRDSNEYEGMNGGDEDAEGEQKQARELLFDADSPALNQLAAMTDESRTTPSGRTTAQPIRGTHAYPPTSGGSLPSSLPPYSALPPVTQVQSQITPHKISRDRLDYEEGDDDGWGEKWSASSETEEDHPLSATTAVPAMRPSVVQISPSLPSSTSPQPSTFLKPASYGEETPVPTTTANFDAQRSAHEFRTDHVTDSTHEGEDENWGFDDSTASPPLAATIVDPEPLPLADSPKAHGRAPSRNPAGKLDSAATAEDGPTGDEDAEEDDWGFGTSSAASPPPSELRTLATSPAESSRKTAPQTNNATSTDRGVGSTDGFEASEPREASEEDDDWGFDDSLAGDSPHAELGAHTDTAHAVEKALGLNESVLDIEPTVPSAGTIGRELGGLS